MAQLAVKFWQGDAFGKQAAVYIAELRQIFVEIFLTAWDWGVECFKQAADAAAQIVAIFARSCQPAVNHAGFVENQRIVCKKAKQQPR